MPSSPPGCRAARAPAWRTCCCVTPKAASATSSPAGCRFHGLPKRIKPISMSIPGATNRCSHTGMACPPTTRSWWRTTFQSRASRSRNCLTWSCWSNGCSRRGYCSPRRIPSTSANRRKPGRPTPSGTWHRRRRRAFLRFGRPIATPRKIPLRYAGRGERRVRWGSCRIS